MPGPISSELYPCLKKAPESFLAVENVCLSVPACVCLSGDAAHAHGACTGVCMLAL